MSRPVAAGAISLALIVLLSLSPAASSTIKSHLLEIFSPRRPFPAASSPPWERGRPGSGGC